MARRLTAVFGIALVLILLTVLIWHVYQHHQSNEPREDATIVQLNV